MSTVEGLFNVILRYKRRSSVTEGNSKTQLIDVSSKQRVHDLSSDNVSIIKLVKL